MSLQDIAGVVSSSRSPASNWQLADGKQGGGSPARILAVAEAALEWALAGVRALVAAQVLFLLEGTGAVCTALELQLGTSDLGARAVRRVRHASGLASGGDVCAVQRSGCK